MLDFAKKNSTLGMFLYFLYIFSLAIRKYKCKKNVYHIELVYITSKIDRLILVNLPCLYYISLKLSLSCAVQYRRPNGWADRAHNWHKYSLGLCDEDRGVGMRRSRTSARVLGWNRAAKRVWDGRNACSAHSTAHNCALSSKRHFYQIKTDEVSIIVLCFLYVTVRH
jgi:hypothetical protein